MSALVPLDLSIDASVDFDALVTLSGLNGVLVALSGATAQLMIRQTDVDPTPLIIVSTTVSSSGSLTLGVGLPAPVGSNNIELAQLVQLGTPMSASLATPTPVVASVATIAAMAALTTTSFVLGNVCFVTAGTGSWFAWSPSDPLTPNGTTIVAGNGGNWLLCGTVRIAIALVAAAMLAGYDRVFWDMLVTWGNGTKTKLLGGNIFVAQTETH